MQPFQKTPPSTFVIDFLGVLFFCENVANCQMDEWVPFKVDNWVPKINFLHFRAKFGSKNPAHSSQCTMMDLPDQHVY